MNQMRQTKLSRLFRHLKHVIHADEGTLVRRRDLLSSRQGDVQLELDLGDGRSLLSRQKWLEMGVPGESSTC
ncbi:hypothetical protein EI77_01305 [Prosthecobacter fusiformis]|uniref:Uncharacterized protein n=2 Tax=Prosthecobacter fusiformis TaxID=48464 RepID=A0A4R7S4Q7_9BACT|nr:hypothetical protein EI77_01305 [Prosthecobacter fusiformis]